MNPVDAVRRACFEAQKFRYVKDSESGDLLTQVLEDEWDTVGEFEARGGGDCDGFSIWTVERAHATLPHDGYYVVAGAVLKDGAWEGHMWVEVDGLWADPTWGQPPAPPSDRGYPTLRRPRSRWRFDGATFGPEERYT